MKIKKSLSILLSFCLIFSQRTMIPVFADNRNSEIVKVNRQISGREFEVGEKFNVNYSITPEILPYSEHTNENEKDIVLVVDTSRSMSEQIINQNRNSNGRGNGYGHGNGQGTLSKSKLEIMKDVLRDFSTKFKNDDKVDFNIIGYSSETNFIYEKGIFNNYSDINKENIKDICVLLKIEENNIYYKYRAREYRANNTWYKYDIKKGNEYYYRLDLNEYPNVENLEFYYDNNDSLVKIENIYDVILANMKADGSTNIGDGLRRAYYLLNNNNGHDKYIVMLTDGQAEAYSGNGNNQFKMNNGDPEEVYITYWRGQHVYPDYRIQSLEYANKIASEKIKNSGIKTFFIGFGSDATEGDAAAKNIQITQSAGGKYYNALNEHEINNIYDEIGKIIETNKVAKIHFEEKIPYGVTISQEDIANLPDGLKIEENKIIGDIEEKVFYQQVKDENDHVVELRANPVSFNITYTANTVNDNCIFGGEPTSFIKYTFEDDSEETIKYFNPVTIKIKQHIERALVSVERTVDKGDSEGNTFDIKYKIVPERIMNSDVSSNNDDKEVVLVLDTSGSMDRNIDGNETYNEYRKRLSIMQNTAVDFINKLSEDKNVKIGLVQYSSTIQSFKPVSNGNVDKLIEAINSMTAEGGTNIGEGLRKAYHMLNNNNGRDKYVILMSDGFPTAFTAQKNMTNYFTGDRFGKILRNNGRIKDYFESLGSTEFATDASSQNVEYVVNYRDNDERGYSLQYAKKMGSVIKDSDKNIKTFVIGFSNGANSQKLQQITNSTGAKYYKALDENAMKNVYDSIQQIVKANINASAHFEENIDGNVEIINPEQLQYGLHFENGKLVGDINDIYYTLCEDGSYYEARPIEFTITYKPLASGSIKFGYNKSSYVDFTTSIGKSEKALLKPLELIVPNSPTISQDDVLHNGQAKVTITGDAESIIEYRIQGETKWSEYTEPLYLDINTTIYARCRRSGLVSDEVSFTTYNINAKAVSSFERNLPDRIALGSEYEITYKFDGDNVKYNVEKPAEIVLILNTSATMKTHMDKLKEAAISFLDNLSKDKDIKVGVVKYYGYGDIVSDLVDIRNVHKLSELKIKINEINSQSGTNLGDALRLGYQLLDNGSTADKHFVIMSDGYANVGIIKADGKYNSSWKNATYVDNLDSSINNKIIRNNGYTRFGLQGITKYSSKDTNKDGLLDRFNIGHKYVTTIANKINETNLNINSHIIHFKRVGGVGDDAGARKNNNEVATLLGVTKGVKPGQKFYLAENADELQMAFNNVAGVIQDSISFNKVEFSETFPQGVKVIEYPNGLTYDESTNTLSGSIKNIKMNNIDKDLNLYKVDGEFRLKIKFNELGEKIFTEGEVDYIEPFESHEKNIRCSGGNVYVLDDSELAIKQTSIVSNNPNSSARAKVGDVITISIEASKDVYQPVVSVLGNSADSVVKEGSNEKKWKAYYTMKQEDIEGKVNFNIQLKDKYLDNTITVTDTTDGTYVMFDKTPPVVSIEYSPRELTNGSVIATIKKHGEDFEVINNDSARSYEFIENGQFTFRFKDDTGNEGECTATVTWIDKEGPEASIKYSPHTVTNGDVIATLESEEDIIITNNNGSSTYTFTDNGEFTFEFKDKAENKSSRTAKVDWIDKEAPHVHVEYSTTKLTNSDVIATLVADKDEYEDFIVTNNAKDKKYKFTKNGEFTFHYRDAAGNTSSVSAKVDWIDKEPPSGYSVSIDSQIVNKNDFSFTINAGEVNTIYNYTITSSGGGEPITGTGDIKSGNSQDIVTDFNISNIDISNLNDGTLTVEVTLTDEVGNEGNEESDSVNMISEEIVEQGIYINGKIKVAEDINIVKSIPTEVGALLKLSSQNTSITISFNKQLSDITFRSLDTNGDEVNVSIEENSNNQYVITSSEQLKGQYILVYELTATRADETVEVLIDVNGRVHDTIEINIVDLPLLD